MGVVVHTSLAAAAFVEVWPAMVVGMPVLQGRPVVLVGEAAAQPRLPPRRRRGPRGGGGGRGGRGRLGGGAPPGGADPAPGHRPTGSPQLARGGGDLRARAGTPHPGVVRSDGGTGAGPARPAARQAGGEGEVGAGRRGGAA